MHKLVVYGTLKPHKEDTHYFNGKMWDVGHFPCVKLDYDNLIPGQIIDVTDEELNRLDRYEGVPHLYTRQRVDCYDLSTGEFACNAFVYEWAGNTDNLREIDKW